MRTLFVVVVLLLVIIAGVGFYQGWFHLSTNSTDQESSATITVDKEKIHQDEQTVKDKMPDFGQDAQKTTKGQNDKPPEQQRQP